MDRQIGRQTFAFLELLSELKIALIETFESIICTPYVPRAGSPRNRNVPRAASPQYYSVPRADSPVYIFVLRAGSPKVPSCN